MDFHQRKCEDLDGKIPSSAVAPALADLDKGLEVLSEQTYQRFGMGIRLMFNTPKSMNEKPLQPKPTVFSFPSIPEAIFQLHKLGKFSPEIGAHLGPMYSLARCVVAHLSGLYQEFSL